MHKDLIMHQPIARTCRTLHTLQLIVVASALAACFVGTAAAQETSLPPQIHPWASFAPGSWKLVRITAESFNEQGASMGTSVSDSKTTLLDSDEDSVTLEMRVCVEVGGKRIDSKPQIVTQGLYGEQENPALKLKEPTAGQVVIEDRKIPCQVREIQWSDANSRTTVGLYYSTIVAPYVLKRQSVTTDLEGKNVLSETTTSVQTLDMPCKILGVLHSACYMKTVQKTPKGSVVTLAVVCPDIPGGVISHSSKELDPSGRLVRRSTLELVDFKIEPEQQRTGVFGRKRPARYRGK
jgi:hypothetical protein